MRQLEHQRWANAAIIFFCEWRMLHTMLDKLPAGFSNLATQNRLDIPFVCPVKTFMNETSLPPLRPSWILIISPPFLPLFITAFGLWLISAYWVYFRSVGGGDGFGGRPRSNNIRSWCDVASLHPLRTGRYVQYSSVYQSRSKYICSKSPCISRKIFWYVFATVCTLAKRREEGKARVLFSCKVAEAGEGGLVTWEGSQDHISKKRRKGISFFWSLKIPPRKIL